MTLAGDKVRLLSFSSSTPAFARWPKRREGRMSPHPHQGEEAPKKRVGTRGNGIVYGAMWRGSECVSVSICSFDKNGEGEIVVEGDGDGDGDGCEC